MIETFFGGKQMQTLEDVERAVGVLFYFRAGIGLENEIVYDMPVFPMHVLDTCDKDAQELARIYERAYY